MANSGKFSTLEGPERLIGTRVLEFELTQVLGSGGMSVVYRGRHRVTHQEVAIKILPPELATHDELKARFVEEARVLALLDHPNIVSLNNFCEAGGRLCLIMQFVDGLTFEQQIVANTRLPPADVARVGIEVCRALEYAHGQNVIHRDIKPSNVLVRATDGAVKVTDFGIAKILGATRLTSTGQTMGTVRYMSPEQVRGKVVDARSDLYSLGATLFEGLTGHTPFEGENQFEIMQQHLNQRPPSLAKLGAQVSAGFEKTLGKALEKKPDDRHQGAKAFREALEREIAGAAGTVPARVHLRKRSSPLQALALGLGATIAVSVAGAGGYLALRKPRPDPAAQPSPMSTTTPQASSPVARRTFTAPHVLQGVTLAADETFEADGLRVQLADGKADAPRLRTAYGAVKQRMRAFLGQSDDPALKEAAAREPAPLTLVVVPQAVLDRPELWPDYDVKAGSHYPSRYVAVKRTLFISAEHDFEKGELPYAVALHVLAPVSGLSNERMYSLAEKFEAFFGAR